MGSQKEDRDLVACILWKMGLFRNEQIGKFFGISYSAFSHIVWGVGVEELLKKEPRVRRKASEINSQFKM
jgi:hypothetical protein